MTGRIKDRKERIIKTFKRLADKDNYHLLCRTIHSGISGADNPVKAAWRLLQLPYQGLPPGSSFSTCCCDKIFNKEGVMNEI